MCSARHARRTIRYTCKHALFYCGAFADLDRGAAKSNIGHLEGGSGIAAVIKTVLVLEKGIIPPNSVNFESLNPEIDAEFLNIKVLQSFGIFD